MAINNKTVMDYFRDKEILKIMVNCKEFECKYRYYWDQWIISPHYDYMD